MTLANLLAVLLLAGIFLFMGYYWSILRPRQGTLDWVALQERKPLTFHRPRYPLERKDALPILLITVIYAFTAFFSLGDTTAPDYRHAFDFNDGQTYTLQLDGEITPSKIWYYPMLGTGKYLVKASADGEHWSTLWSKDGDGDDGTYYWADADGYEPKYALVQDYKSAFKWKSIDLTSSLTFRYLSITGQGERDVFQLGRLLFADENGDPIPISVTNADGTPAPEDLALVFSVDETTPEAFSWRNSTYFDEIYHARTALEHIEGYQAYEWTHPPLGKLILGLGIRLFGMSAFGWRFMGTLFGVGMVPLMYLFLKNLFGKTPVAVCGTVLLATEFMHLTQTRIATIDTYGVFFTLLSYLFFYRWLTDPATPDKKGRQRQGYLSLALCGITWGIGCACKWTVIYAGVGLAVLYVLNMIWRIRAWDRSVDAPRMGPWIGKTLGISVLCFLFVPFVVYTLSYIPYAQVAGVTDYSLGHNLAGLAKNFPVLVRNLLGSDDPGAFQKDSLVGVMLDKQWSMLNYHKGVHSSHPYSSRWYQWLTDARPILYYSRAVGSAATERFSSFNNPVLSWAGLLALLTCAARCFRKVWAKLVLLWSVGFFCAGMCWVVGRVKNGDFDPALSGAELGQRMAVLVVLLLCYLVLTFFIARYTEYHRSGLDVFITVGFFAQFLPWVLINRTTFSYHYFPSTIFLLLALCRAFDEIMESKRGNRKPVYALTATSGVLYLMFYPALTGLTMASWYSVNILKFMPSWPY